MKYIIILEGKGYAISRLYRSEIKSFDFDRYSGRIWIFETLSSMVAWLGGRDKRFVVVSCDLETVDIGILKCLGVI